MPYPRSSRKKEKASETRKIHIAIFPALARAKCGSEGQLTGPCACSEWAVASKLFSHGEAEEMLLGVLHAQRLEEVYQVPGVFGRDRVGERGHRGPVQAGKEGAVEVLVAVAALPMGAGGEVERRDVEAPIVEERGGRGAVALAALPVAVEAGLRVPHRLALLARFGAVRRLGYVGDGVAGALFLPARREGLDVLRHVAHGALAQRGPGGHVGVVEAFAQRAQQVVVDRQRAARRRPAPEDGAREGARPRGQPLRRVGAALAALAVAREAVALVDGLAARNAGLVERARRVGRLFRLRLISRRRLVAGRSSGLLRRWRLGQGERAREQRRGQEQLPSPHRHGAPP